MQNYNYAEATFVIPKLLKNRGWAIIPPKNIFVKTVKTVYSKEKRKLISRNLLLKLKRVNSIKLDMCVLHRRILMQYEKVDFTEFLS